MTTDNPFVRAAQAQRRLDAPDDLRAGEVLRSYNNGEGKTVHIALPADLAAQCDAAVAAWRESLTIRAVDEVTSLEDIVCADMAADVRQNVRTLRVTIGPTWPHGEVFGIDPEPPTAA